MIDSRGDYLLIVDVQNDFCPGGALEVRRAGGYGGFLVSDDAAYITGQVISVSGGLTMVD